MPPDLWSTLWPLWFALLIFAMAWLLWLISPDDDDEDDA
jgi:hypothetical protein